MHQIATLNDQRGELDDQELAALDDQGIAESDLAALGQALPALEAQAADAEAELAKVTAVLDAEEADLRSRRPEFAATLNGAEIAAYERAKQHFDGVAIARLEGHRCQGCHLDLSAAEMDQVKATPEGAVPECPQCGRYLVR